MESSKNASSYANLKVEDRLRLYGIQLKGSKESKILETESQIKQRATTPILDRSSANMEETHSVNINLAEKKKKIIEEFEKRQADFAAKREKSQKKLNDLYSFKP